MKISAAPWGKMILPKVLERKRSAEAEETQEDSQGGTLPRGGSVNQMYGGGSVTLLYKVRSQR